MDELPRRKYAAWAWGIDVAHRGRKQQCGVERAQVRAATAQRNPVTCASAPSAPGAAAPRHRRRWWEAKTSILREAVRGYLAQPRYPLASTAAPTAYLLTGCWVPDWAERLRAPPRSKRNILQHQSGAAPIKWPATPALLRLRADRATMVPRRRGPRHHPVRWRAPDGLLRAGPRGGKWRGRPADAGRRPRRRGVRPPREGAMAQDRSLGSYRLVERLGRGHGGAYRAVHRTDGRVAAVKVLPAALAGGEDARRWFERGAASAARLWHPNILPVWEYGEADGRLYLAMPFVAGGTLHDRLRAGPLPPARALHYVAQIAAALDHAHDHGIVHRDVKPANILLDSQDRAYLADFGIARAGGGRAARPRHGSGRHARVHGPRAGARRGGRRPRRPVRPRRHPLRDAHRAVPLPGASPVAVLYQHLTAPVPTPMVGEAPLPAPVVAVVRRALAKRPDERYQRAGDLAAALEAAIAAADAGGRAGDGRAGQADTAVPGAVAAGPAARVDRGVAPRAARWRGKALALAAAATLAALLLAALGLAALTARTPRATTAADAGAAPTVPATPTLPAPSAAPLAAPPSALPVPSLTATPTPPARPVTAPAGWPVYRGPAAVPVTIAYPPGWQPDGTALAQGQLAFRPPSGKGIALLLQTDGQPVDAGATAGALLAQYLQQALGGCTPADAAPNAATYAGIAFARAVVACDWGGVPYAVDVGIGLRDRVPWLYRVDVPAGELRRR